MTNSNRKQRRHRRKLIGLAVLATLATGACTTGSKQAKAPIDGGRFELISGLAKFDACEDYLSWIKRQASDRVGPYGLSGSGGGIVDNIKSEIASGLKSGAVESAGSGPVSGRVADVATANPTFSTTNNQEEGVDEPDLVKTDGKRMVVIQGNTLHVLDVSGEVAKELGQVLVGDDVGNGELLINGDRALVLAQGYGQAIPGSAAGSGERSDIASLPAGGGPTALLIEVNLANPAKPTVMNRLELAGAYLNARLVGSTARVVVRSSPDSLDFVYPSRPNSLDRARKLNQQIIADSTIDQWLPTYRLLTAGGATSTGRLVECDQLHRPKEFAGLSTLSILTVDLGKSLTPGNAVGIVADGDTVYASTRNLYVTTNQLPETKFDNDGNAKPPIWNDATEYNTSVHRFDITGTGPARYTASGAANGHVLNGYSLSEYDGILRVATTKGTPWGVTPTSESQVTLLKPNGQELVEVGKVGNLGKGERIYAVRFVGPVGYVVTFRQTDPLYTLDLSNPAAPAVKGELKILGYSAYLHPIGDGLLLGVGQDATEQGRGVGAQLSLFDVSDIAKPTRLAQMTLPQGWTNAEHDYHAFLWWEKARTAVIPVQLWDKGGSEPQLPLPSPAPVPSVGFVPSTGFVGAIGFDIGTKQTPIVKERGRVTHTGRATACEVPRYPGGGDITGPDGRKIAITRSPDCMNYGLYGPPIERAVIVGDRLLTISVTGVATSNLTTFADVGWLAF